MDANSPEMRSLIDDLSRSAVGQVAPEELDMFDELSQEYYDDPTPPDPNEEASDDALGFGMGAMLAAMTPAATAATTLLISFLVQVVVQSVADEGADRIRNTVRRMLGKEVPPDTPEVGLSREQLAEAKRMTYEEAVRFGVDESEAERLASALVGRLALGE